MERQLVRYCWQIVAVTQQMVLVPVLVLAPELALALELDLVLECLDP